MDTPSRLRALAQAAPAGSWYVIPGAEPFVRAADDKTVATGVRTVQCARLIALAPDLAVWAADAAEWVRDFLMGDNIDPGDEADLGALLARLDEITGGKE